MSCFPNTRGKLQELFSIFTRIQMKPERRRESLIGKFTHTSAVLTPPPSSVVPDQFLHLLNDDCFITQHASLLHQADERHIDSLPSFAQFITRYVRRSDTFELAGPGEPPPPPPSSPPPPHRPYFTHYLEADLARGAATHSLFTRR